MKKYKPLNILDNKGFWPEKAAVADAIRELLAIGRCTVALPVRDYGLYRSPQWRDKENHLVEWQSVDWYIYHAIDEDRMQVDSARLLHDLCEEAWRDEKLMGDHYDLFMMEEDMYDAAEEEQGLAEVPYSVGRAERMKAAVISTHRIEQLWGMSYSSIKTEVMRQLCFMFGLPSRTRRSTIARRGEEAFCKNVCILRMACEAPRDWERMTEDRLRFGALCPACVRDLRAFFAGLAAESK